MTMEDNQGFHTRSLTLADQAARGLAWFSIAVGAAEILFPGAISRAVGLEKRDGLLRAYGVREMASGIGALQPNAAPAIWSRVGGDVMDLATLAMARGGDGEQRRCATRAMVAIAAVTVLDIAVASMLTQQSARPRTFRDYSDRSGFPQGAAAARGAASRYIKPGLRTSAEAGRGAEPA